MTARVQGLSWFGPRLPSGSLPIYTPAAPTWSSSSSSVWGSYACPRSHHFVCWYVLTSFCPLGQCQFILENCAQLSPPVWGNVNFCLLCPLPVCCMVFGQHPHIACPVPTLVLWVPFLLIHYPFSTWTYQHVNIPASAILETNTGTESSLFSIFSPSADTISPECWASDFSHGAPSSTSAFHASSSIPWHRFFQDYEKPTCPQSKRE